MKITMAAGSGGASTASLINDIFIKEFDNETVASLEDCAVVEGNAKIAMTTDSFVVTPVEYPGGDIGRLAVCGTVNDLLARGATPKYMTCGFILQTGLDTDDLTRMVKSMAATAKEAGIKIVAGDTKVVEGDSGLMINTTGVGFVPENLDIKSNNAKPGDAVIVTGNLGEHHAAILSTRLQIDNNIKSDTAPLNKIVANLLDNGIKPHAMRDVTRGGLATVLKEIAENSKAKIELNQNDLPVSKEISDFCGLLGLDPLYMGNEGKMAIILAPADLDKALDLIRSSDYGANAVAIGSVVEEDEAGTLLLKTTLGGLRQLDVLQGEGLPRIC
ncbi:MAG: hydrogenase expression/formation protein HypE [Lachnospiraceae bacterium]|nr:hydrogenase expression/formation protein HypE [Lachnospiraceae bacterium]